ncbi:MAG: DUF805 domain-containing protein [Hyphomicrobiaceae bacterium]
MKAFQFFLGFQGRVDRMGFGLGTLVAAMVSNAALYLLGGKPFQIQPTPLLGALALVLSLPVWALTAKRYHDLGMSGWWSLLPFASVPLCLLGGIMLAVAVQQPGLMAQALLVLLLTLAALLLSMWHMVKLCFFKGTVGSNDFGPEPSLARDLLGSGSLADELEQMAAAHQRSGEPAGVGSPSIAGHRGGARPVALVRASPAPGPARQAFGRRR